MSADSLFLNKAAASKALAALERYEPDARKLAGSWLDAELYSRVAQEIEDVRRCCASLPLVSAQWTTLLIAHAELVHCLWRSTRPESSTDATDRRLHLERVIACSHGLRDACRRVATGGRQAPPP